MTSPYFDNFILALILISSGLLALENPTDPNADINKVTLCFLNQRHWFFTSFDGILNIVLKLVLILNFIDFQPF